MRESKLFVHNVNNSIMKRISGSEVTSRIFFSYVDKIDKVMKKVSRKLIYILGIENGSTVNSKEENGKEK